MARVVAVLSAVVLGLLPRLGNASSCIVPVPGAETGSVRIVHDLPGGGALIGGEEALFRLDPAAAAIVPVPEAETGWVDTVHDLPGGGALIGAREGLFRLDPAAAAIVPVPGPETGFMVLQTDALGYVATRTVQDLPGGGPLIGGEEALFRLDPAAAAIVPVPGPETGSVRILHDLPGGGVLIGAEEGLFFLHGASWRDAQLTLENQSALEQIRPHSEEVASNGSFAIHARPWQTISSCMSWRGGSMPIRRICNDPGRSTL